jgi:1-phosphatidylinositol-4-phosphate 5-kinase
MSKTYAYVDIGCTIISMMACSIICILGVISPIYRKYPSKWFFLMNVEL